MSITASELVKILPLCDLLTPQDLAQKSNFIIDYLNYG